MTAKRETEKMIVEQEVMQRANEPYKRHLPLPLSFSPSHLSLCQL